MPWLPSEICHSISFRYAASSIAPPRMGVIRAGIDPRNFMGRFL
jgi:hypothetical protein